jgi:uncharacterized protein YfeS
LVDRQITAGQFLQGSDAILPVIDRLEMVEAQQLGQLAGIDLVTLATFFQQSRLSGITHHEFGDVGLQYLV